MCYKSIFLLYTRVFLFDLDLACLPQVRNKHSGHCIDTMGRKTGEKIGMVTCHGMGGNQVS